MNNSNIIEFKPKNSIVDLAIAFMKIYDDVGIDMILKDFECIHHDENCIRVLNTHLTKRLVDYTCKKLMDEYCYKTILMTIRKEYEFYLTKTIYSKIANIEKLLFSPDYYFQVCYDMTYNKMLNCMDTYRTALHCIPMHYTPVSKTIDFILTDMRSSFIFYKDYIYDAVLLSSNSGRKQLHERVEIHLYLMRYFILEYANTLKDKSVRDAIFRIQDNHRLQRELFDKTLTTYANKDNPIFDNN